MRSQVCFVMHSDDERDFEQFLISDESIRFIAGPRSNLSLEGLAFRKVQRFTSA